MRAGITTALALLLAISAGAQASQVGLEGSYEAETGGFDDVVSVSSQSAPPPQSPEIQDLQGEAEALQREAEAQAEEAGDQASQQAAKVQARAERAAERLLNTVDLGRIREEVDHAVADAQQQLPAITEDGEDGAAPAEEPAMESQSSVAEAWPEVAPEILWIAGAAGLGFLAWFAGNSATVGAGAAGTAAASQGRRFLPYASPLFTRFEKDTVLGHPKREAIYGQIVEKPGVTLQDLCDESGLSRTAVSHHLRLLEQQHLIVSKRVGRSRHFFENGGRYGRDQKDAYAVLHNDRSKDIHAYIEHHPGAIQKDLCKALGIQASVAHWHVKRLKEANLIETVRQGRTVSYFPATTLQRPAFA